MSISSCSTYSSSASTIRNTRLNTARVTEYMDELGHQCKVVFAQFVTGMWVWEKMDSAHPLSPSPWSNKYDFIMVNYFADSKDQRNFLETLALTDDCWPCRDNWMFCKTAGCRAILIPCTPPRRNSPDPGQGIKETLKKSAKKARGEDATCKTRGVLNRVGDEGYVKVCCKKPCTSEIEKSNRHVAIKHINANQLA